MSRGDKAAEEMNSNWFLLPVFGSQAVHGPQTDRCDRDWMASPAYATCCLAKWSVCSTCDSKRQMSSL